MNESNSDATTSGSALHSLIRILHKMELSQSKYTSWTNSIRNRRKTGLSRVHDGLIAETITAEKYFLLKIQNYFEWLSNKSLCISKWSELWQKHKENVQTQRWESGFFMFFGSMNRTFNFLGSCVIFLCITFKKIVG